MQSVVNAPMIFHNDLHDTKPFSLKKMKGVDHNHIKSNIS